MIRLGSAGEAALRPAGGAAVAAGGPVAAPNGHARRASERVDGGEPAAEAAAARGVVYLVGAGPGDPGLITVRGLGCLRRAEVVVYDRLIHDDLLAEAPPAAERIFAGKSPGCHALRQEEISAILVERARAGRVVVRLKGGDPFVFGRGGEEAAACAAAGVRWEVVPGVSSAIGVPARAGIPVTHRGAAGAFAVVTGHRACSREDDGLDWSALARIDTLIVLMGVERLAHVAERLIEHGRSPQTPAAIVERGTDPGERVVIGTLTDIADRAAQAGVRPPATIVIGEVVRLRELWTGWTGAAPALGREGAGGRAPLPGRAGPHVPASGAAAAPGSLAFTSVDA